MLLSQAAGCAEASEKKFFHLEIERVRDILQSNGQIRPDDCLSLRPTWSVENTLNDGLCHIIFIAIGYLYVVKLTRQALRKNTGRVIPQRLQHGA